MLMIVLCFAALYIAVKFFKIFETPEKPQLFHSGSSFVREILNRCKSFNSPYSPPILWGKSGHVQTALYGKVGRWNCPIPCGKRNLVTLDSGETISYDVFQPTCLNSLVDSCTILVCPGICNSSEKKYIRTFVHYAMSKGYRVFVLNHIGVLPTVKLTSPRIFTYGETKYFSCMVKQAKTLYPESIFVIVGFSMGGNIVSRYLGEDISRQKSIACAISMCQGYHGIRSTLPMQNGYRRLYNYLITLNFKKVLKPHWNELFNLNENNLHRSTSALFDEKKVKFATSLQDIEDGLLRHMEGYPNSYEFMRNCGCEDILNNINLPFLLVNSEDDPLIVNDIHDIPIQHAESHEESLFVRTKHGGHLGYFKGQWFWPEDLTLVEDYVIEFIEAILDLKFCNGHKLIK